jgi:hypothetical protein
LSEMRIDLEFERIIFVSNNYHTEKTIIIIIIIKCVYSGKKCVDYYN